MEPGQSWGYRARRVDDLIEVLMLRLGTQSPPRVLVRFVEDRRSGIRRRSCELHRAERACRVTGYGTEFIETRRTAFHALHRRAARA